MAAPVSTASNPSFPTVTRTGSAPAKPEPAVSKRRRPYRSGRFWKVVAFGAHPGIPGGLLTGWWLWERVGGRLHPTLVVPESPFGLFRIRIETFHGQPIQMADSILADGATICELHCDNRAVLQFTRKSSAIYRAGRMELRAIADYLVQSDVRVDAIHGVTLLGAAAARLGFHRRPLPLTRWTRAVRLFMNGLLALYNVDGVSRLKRGRTLRAAPVEIWMSREELLRSYASSGPDPASHECDEPRVADGARHPIPDGYARPGQIELDEPSLALRSFFSAKGSNR